MEIKISINQIHPGTEYEGLIEGLEENVNYHLSFGIPIDGLKSEILPEEESAKIARAKELYNFSVTKSGNSIEITDELFKFLTGTAGIHVLKSYFSIKSGSGASAGMSYKMNISTESVPKILR
jgi:hypothetical protein